MTLMLILATLQAGSFELADGDRVVLLGNTFVERDLQHNRLETLLTSRFHAKTVVFRNLGWDGDTVFGLRIVATPGHTRVPYTRNAARAMPAGGQMGAAYPGGMAKSRASRPVAQ